MKCVICKNELVHVYLDKVAGTYIKNSEGKRLVVCCTCQKKHGNDKAAMLEAVA